MASSWKMGRPKRKRGLLFLDYPMIARVHAFFHFLKWNISLIETSRTVTLVYFTYWNIALSFNITKTWLSQQPQGLYHFRRQIRHLHPHIFNMGQYPHVFENMPNNARAYVATTYHCIYHQPPGKCDYIVRLKNCIKRKQTKTNKKKQKLKSRNLTTTETWYHQNSHYHSPQIPT